MEDLPEVREKVEGYRRLQMNSLSKHAGPAYGPVSSPAIFVAKWLRKTNELQSDLQHDQRDDTTHTYRKHKDNEALHAVFDLMLAFLAERKIVMAVYPGRFGDLGVPQLKIDSLNKNTNTFQRLINGSCMLWKKSDDPLYDNEDQMTELEKEKNRDLARDCFRRVLEAQEAGRVEAGILW